MSGVPPEDDEPATPAERRLSEVLASLRDDPPRATPGAALAVVTRARWQGPLLAALHTASRIVAAVGDVVALGLGRGGDGGRDQDDPQAPA